MRGYGATVARLTPDQTVGRSNRSGLILAFDANLESQRILRLAVVERSISSVVRALVL